MSELDGKTILVTGASKGIGAAIATRLAADGATVIAQYGRDRAGAEAALAACPAGRKHLLAADFAEPASADTLWYAAVEAAGRVDVLVANAAVMHIGGGIDAPDAEWDAVWEDTMRVNVLAPARLMRNAVRHFREAGGGGLVTLTSWVVHRGSSVPDLLAYAASKSALAATTKTIARAHAKDNILAYCVAPGVVRTQMSIDAAAPQGGEAAVSAGLALGEWVPPEDVADVVAYLSGGRARHLTGATIDVNGASYVR